MKLTPEEIRHKVKRVASRIGEFTLENRLEEELTKIIEEATGEKLPEPFDEKNVRHGSVWESGQSLFLLLKPDNAHIFYSPKPNSFYAVALKQFNNTDGVLLNGLLNRTTATEMAEHLRICHFKYIGQYDFAAGLPK